MNRVEQLSLSLREYANDQEAQKQQQREKIEREREILLEQIEEMKEQEAQEAETRRQKHEFLKRECMEDLQQVEERKQKELEQQKKEDLEKFAAGLRLQEERDRKRDQESILRREAYENRLRFMSDSLQQRTVGSTAHAPLEDLSARDEIACLSFQEEGKRKEMLKEKEEAERKKQEELETFHANLSLSMSRASYKKAVEDEINRPNLAKSLDLGMDEVSYQALLKEKKQSHKAALDAQVKIKEVYDNMNESFPEQERKLNSSYLKELDELERESPEMLVRSSLPQALLPRPKTSRGRLSLSMTMPATATLHVAPRARSLTLPSAGALRPITPGVRPRTPSLTKPPSPLMPQTTAQRPPSSLKPRTPAASASRPQTATPPPGTTCNSARRRAPRANPNASRTPAAKAPELPSWVGIPLAVSGRSAVTSSHTRMGAAATL
eukprot:TRINITY_DN1639_c0_g1_i6.p1 TRINITY_DN1639_c0_g1~~TRINITY_DN1639_c0_g1_i6.p1  ORF type:complete len:439 (+),score=128.46 TRINITY_DN1639_c0_g1_i6:413-1729(+)